MMSSMLARGNRFKTLLQGSIPAPLQGILLALVSTALFVWVGVIVRILSDSVDLFQILLVRQVVFLIVLIPAIAVSLDVLLKPRRMHLHLLRISGAFAALYLGF
ncbi:hypothetical protein [Aliamphritea spongicola]|nr:hypothetical protein [Aliamphritea spongicola]